MSGLICVHCGRDINAIWQDNMSEIPGSPMCEDCYNGSYHPGMEQTTEEERAALVESRMYETEMDYEEWKASTKR